jgi:hypothetical protein
VRAPCTCRRSPCHAGGRGHSVAARQTHQRRDRRRCRDPRVCGPTLRYRRQTSRCRASRRQALGERVARGTRADRRFRSAAGRSSGRGARSKGRSPLSGSSDTGTRSAARQDFQRAMCFAPSRGVARGASSPRRRPHRCLRPAARLADALRAGGPRSRLTGLDPHNSNAHRTSIRPTSELDRLPRRPRVLSQVATLTTRRSVGW